MARVFISHSSRDNEPAARIKAWLSEQNFETPFLDFDKHAGIPPGADWEKTLYREIERSEAVIIIQTPNWLDSKWCFVEFAQARALGKAIFPIIETPTGDTLISPDIQKVDLRSDRAGELERLASQLTQIALNAQGGFAWDKGRPPYPGLLAFQEEDAALYFGRDDDIRRLIERLNARRAQGGPKLIALLGASGSGKSSLLRAGVIPRLKRSGRNWIVLPPMRPQERPVDELARCLAVACGGNADWHKLHEQLNGEHVALALSEIANDRRVNAAANEAQMLLPIDQAEELFGVADPDQARHFFEILNAALSGDLPFIAIMALRSDYLGPLQSAEHLKVRFEEFSLGPMPLARIPQIIEGPARVAGLRVDNAFVQQAVRDAETADALPLLAFALRELYDRASGDHYLSLTEYNAMGDAGAKLTPLENSVRKAADDVLNAARPDYEELTALREAFVPAMVRVNDQGEYVRRPARWDSLPAKSHRLLELLAAARLLIVSQQGAERMVEVAHEALLRKWPRLTAWLDEAREFLAGKQQLEVDLRDWERASERDKPDALLTGLKLNRARGWLSERPKQLEDKEKTYIQASIDHADAEERRKARQRRIITRASIAAAVVLACFAVAAGWQWKVAEHQTQVADQAKYQAEFARDKAQAQLLAVQARRADIEATSPYGIERAAALALASIAKSNKLALIPEVDAVETARSALIRLPVAVLREDSWLAGATALADGRLATVTGNGNLNIWPRGGTGVLKPVFSRGGAIDPYTPMPAGLALAGLVDGRLATVDVATVDVDGKERTIEIWPKDFAGAPLPLPPQGSRVTSLAGLPDGRLASSGEDGKIRIWPKDFRSTPRVLPEVSSVTRLAVLPDGRLATSAEDDKGTIEIWPKDFAGAPLPLPPQGSRVTSLAGLPDGRLASSGKDGKIRIWPKDFRSAPRVLPQVSSVTSIAVLPDGRLASENYEGTITLFWPKDFQEAPEIKEAPEVLSYVDSYADQVNKTGDAAMRVNHLVGLMAGQLASNSAKDGTIKIWGTGETGEPRILLQGSSVTSLAVLPDGRLASAGDDSKGTIKVWPGDFAGPPIVRRQGTKVSSLAVLPEPDGRLISSSGDKDGKIRLWPKDFGSTWEDRSQGSPVTSLAVLPEPDGRLISSSGDYVKLWPKDFRNAPVPFPDPDNTSDPQALAVLAVLKDGRLVTASNDTELRDVGIRIWSKDFTGKPKVYQTSGGRAVYSLTVLKDERLASSGSDFQITLWPRDFTSKKEILDKKASVMAVLEDGRLASGDEDGKIRLWPKDFGGTPEVLSHGSPVTSLVVLKDGRLASGGKDGTIKLWLVDEQKLIAALCLRVGRDLSKADWGRYFGDTPWQPSCSAFGIPSNWQQTDDDAESSALASDNTPTEVQPAAPPASAVLRVPLASADLSPALPEPAQPPVAHEPAAQSSPQTAVPPASAKESPVPAPDFGDPGNIGKPREIATPVAPKNPGPRPAQGSQHVAHTAPHGNMPTTTGNTTSQLNQQELARQKSVASMPDNIISGFFRSLFR